MVYLGYYGASRVRKKDVDDFIMADGRGIWLVIDVV